MTRKLSTKLLSHKMNDSARYRIIGNANKLQLTTTHFVYIWQVIREANEHIARTNNESNKQRKCSRIQFQIGLQSNKYAHTHSHCVGDPNKMCPSLFVRPTVCGSLFYMNAPGQNAIPSNATSEHVQQ